MAVAGPTGPVVDHFLWMRKEFREDQEYSLVAWDRSGEPATRSVYSLKGALHAFNGVMRTLSGLPARTMTFTWNDTGQEATAVFVEADAALLVFVFRGCAASAELARVVDASIDAIAVLAGPAALQREGAVSWDAPLVAKARTLLVARLFRAAAAVALPLRLPAIADALGVSARGAAMPAAAAASPGRASTPGSGGFSPHAPVATPSPPSLPLPAASLAADTELTVLESDVNDALQGPLLPLPLLPAGGAPPRSPFSTASGDSRIGVTGSPALLRSRPPPTGGEPAVSPPAFSAAQEQPPPLHKQPAASGSRGSAHGPSAGGGGGGSRGVAVDWACTGSAVCVVPGRGGLGGGQQQQQATRGGGAPLLLPAALVSRLRPADEADLSTLLSTLLLLPQPAAGGEAASAGATAAGGAGGLLGALAAESEAHGRGFGWHWPPAAADLSLSLSLTRGRSSRTLSAAADPPGRVPPSATAGVAAAAAAAPPVPPLPASSSAAARAITRIRLVALPVAAFARLPVTAVGGCGGASAAVPRTPVLRRTHGSALDVLRRSPGGALGSGGADQRLLSSPPAPPLSGGLASAGGGRREAPGPPVRHSVALWASRVAFWRPADEGSGEWPEPAALPPDSGGPPPAAGGRATTPRSGSGGPPGSQLLRALFAPLPTPAPAAAAAATAASAASSPPSTVSPGAGLKRISSISGGVGATPGKTAPAAPAPAAPASGGSMLLPPGLGQTTRLLVLACLEPHAGGGLEGGAGAAAAGDADAAHAAAAPPPPSAGPSLLLVLALERRTPLPSRGGGSGGSQSGGPFDAVLSAVGPLAAKCLRRVARDRAVASVAEALSGRTLLLQQL